MRCCEQSPLGVQRSHRFLSAAAAAAGLRLVLDELAEVADLGGELLALWVCLVRLLVQLQGL